MSVRRVLGSVEVMRRKLEGVDDREEYVDDLYPRIIRSLAGERRTGSEITQQLFEIFSQHIQAMYTDAEEGQRERAVLALHGLFDAFVGACTEDGDVFQAARQSRQEILIRAASRC